jgi:predicted RNA-binding protein YlqC (UPF0109 family)
MTKKLNEMTDEELKSELNGEDLPDETENDIPEEEYEDIEDSGEETEESDEGSPEPETEDESLSQESVDYKQESERLKAELEKVKAEKENLDPVIGRQGQELGTLRKKITELESQIKETNDPKKLEELNDKFIENPYLASLEVSRQERETAEKKQVLERLQREEYTKTNAETVKRIVPKFEELKPEIEEILKEDSIDPNIIKDVMNDIYSENPAILIQLGKRAELLRRTKQLEAVVNKEKGKNERILDNVSKTAQQINLNGKTAGGTANSIPSLSAVDIYSMNYEEITALHDKLFTKKK